MDGQTTLHTHMSSVLYYVTMTYSDILFFRKSFIFSPENFTIELIFVCVLTLTCISGTSHELTWFHPFFLLFIAVRYLIPLNLLVLTSPSFVSIYQWLFRFRCRFLIFTLPISHITQPSLENNFVKLLTSWFFQFKLSGTEKNK